MNVQVTQQAKKRYLQKYPLVRPEDLITPLITDGWVKFVDGQQRFIAQGYLGKQNKGAGWLVSWEPTTIDQGFFAELLRRAKGKRQRFYDEEGTTAFRLFNGEGDGLGGITIELYADFAVFSWYNPTIYQKQPLILAAFQQVFPEVQGIYEKIRFESELPESRHVWGESAPEPLLVQENFVTYATYLNEGLMTGIFLDQKDVRGRLVEGLAAGKSLLNMFSYTGAFSVAAAMGGAVKTTSVDLAKRSLAKTQEQFRVNGLDPADQAIHVMDVFSYFNYAQKKELTFDVIVLDPPSFARNKKKVFSVAKNYGELIADSIPLLKRQGLLIASTNAANLSRTKFRQMIEQEFQAQRVGFKLLEEHHLPADFVVDPHFPEGDYLKVFFYQINQ